MLYASYIVYLYALTPTKFDIVLGLHFKSMPPHANSSALSLEHYFTFLQLITLRLSIFAHGTTGPCMFRKLAIFIPNYTFWYPNFVF